MPNVDGSADGSPQGWAATTPTAAGPVAMPGFTVVIPAFDAGTLLVEALESVAAQTRAAAWVVVVDDGSHDGTADAAAAALTRLGLPGDVIRQPNQGIAAARNAGLAARRTNWIALLDADDLWRPEHLAELERAVTLVPDAVVAFCDSELFGDPDVPDGPIARATAVPLAERSPADRVHVLSPRLFDALLPGQFFPVSASAFRMDGATEPPAFDRELRTGEDRYFFLRRCTEGRFVYVDRRTAWTRRHAGNTTHARHEDRRHQDLITLLAKMTRSGHFAFDAIQREAFDAIAGSVTSLAMYSSSCNGLPAYLRTRRRLRDVLGRTPRTDGRSLLRAAAVSLGIKRA